MSEIKRWDLAALGSGFIGMKQRDDGAFVRNSDHEAEVARLRAEVEAYRKDAERYRWLHKRAISADFTMTDCVGLTFGLPQGSRVSGDVDKTIDAAMGASA